MCQQQHAHTPGGSSPAPETGTQPSAAAGGGAAACYRRKGGRYSPGKEDMMKKWALSFLLGPLNTF